MSKFKVGDKVQYLGNGLYGQVFSGQIYTIKGIREQSEGLMMCFREVHPSSHCYLVNHFELAKKGSEKVSKKEIQKYLVIDTSCGNLNQGHLYTKTEILDGTHTDNSDHEIIDVTTGKKYTLKKSVKLVPKK